MTPKEKVEQLLFVIGQEGLYEAISCNTTIEDPEFNELRLEYLRIHTNMQNKTERMSEEHGLDYFECLG